jgi:hypothetical protein
MKDYQTHQANWQGIPLSVCYCPDWTRAMGRPLAHLTVKAAVPLPVTETGFISRFLAPGTVDDGGGPVAFVLAWLDYSATLPAWKDRQEQAAQLSLF